MICDHARKLTVRSLGPWPELRLRTAFPGAAIELEQTPAGFGGTRNWFLCPYCERRCAILYAPCPNSWACRICCKGRYASEVEGPIDRLYRKARKLRCRLGQPDPNMSLPFPGRPHGMHWSTYLRLRKEGLALEARLLEYLRRNLLGPKRIRTIERSLTMEDEGAKMPG